MGVINNIFGKLISGLTQNSNAKEKQTSAKKNERLFNFDPHKSDENDLYDGLVSLSKTNNVTDTNLKTKTAAQKTYQKGTLEYTLNLIDIEPSIINDAVYNPKGQITDFKIAYNLSSILNNNQQSSSSPSHQQMLVTYPTMWMFVMWETL